MSIDAFTERGSWRSDDEEGKLYISRLLEDSEVDNDTKEEDRREEGIQLDRRTLEDTLANFSIRTLLSPCELLEPSYSQVLVTSESNNGTRTCEIYENVTMANLNLLIPAPYRKLDFRPFDNLRLDFTTIVGISGNDTLMQFTAMTVLQRQFLTSHFKKVDKQES